MQICPNCKQETEPGKFCTNCGAQLPTEEIAASSDPAATPLASEGSASAAPGETPAKPNAAVETAKEAAANFGGFFMELLKKPSTARNVKENEWISGIITVALLSLLFSLGTYLSLSSSYFSPSFTDAFLIPFLQILLFFAISIAVTYGGAKLASKPGSIQEMAAKTGAFLVPFLALSVIAVLLLLVELTMLGGLFITISLLAPIVLIPSYILLDKPGEGFDSIYILIGVYAVNLIVFFYLASSKVQSIFNPFSLY